MPLTKEEELRMEYSLFRSINVDFPPPPILHRSYNELDFEFEDVPEPLEVPICLQRINAPNVEQVPMCPLQRINAPDFEQVPMRPSLQRIVSPEFDLPTNAPDFEQVPMRPSLQRIVSPEFDLPTNAPDIEQVPMRLGRSVTY